MKLFKNVDLCDLESILSKGILSMTASRNFNWRNGRRANNSNNKVYLFSPTSQHNSFTNYGIVLLEVETEAEKSEMLDNDANYGKYDEYTCDFVSPDSIEVVYIPEIFRYKISITSDKIKFVKISASWYNEDISPVEKCKCTDDVLRTFAETAQYECSSDFNFFRGITKNHHMIDLYDLHYHI